MLEQNELAGLFVYKNKVSFLHLKYWLLSNCCGQKILGKENRKRKLKVMQFCKLNLN